MKTCKKLFSLLLVAVMLVSVIPFASFADGESVDDSVSAVTPGAGDPTPAGDAAPAGGAGTPTPAPTTEYTVQVRIGSDKNTAVDGQTGKSTQPDTLATSEINNGPAAFAILNKCFPGVYPDSKYNFEAASVKGNTIYIRVSEVTHSYTIKVTDSGKNSPEGHLMMCNGSCGDTGCTETKRVPHDPAEMTLTNQKTATCTSEGYTGDKVYDCGYTEKGTAQPKVAHIFTNDKGKCTNCAAVKYQINVTVDGTAKNETYVDESGTAVLDSASKVMPLIGLDPAKYTAGSSFVNTGYVISFTATTIPTTTSYTNLALTVDGKSENVGINPAYSKEGTVSASDAAAILKAAKRSYELSKYNVEVKASGSTIYMTLNTIGRYTVNCIVNGEKFAPKTNVPYYGTFTNSDAQAILKAADITVNGTYQQSVVSVSGSVITVELYNEIVVRVYNNANSFSQVTMRVGYPYINYLGTNLINNATFGGITIKNQAGQNTYKSASDVNGGKALVGAYDEEVTIQRNGDSCTLNFLRSDGTVLESRKLYAGDQIGTLPSYIVGNVPAVWTYNGKPISATDVYNFKTTSVNIQPYFGGISDVYVDVYTNGNVKTLQTRVKVTDMVQNGVLYLNSEVKSAISSALRNTSNKNLTYTAFFDASTWSDFIKTKNTNGAAEPIRVGDNSERQGSVYLYVMVNNVTQKATDSTNPKTGDDVKLGVAVAVLAVAVVGFGAAIVIKKKKGVQ